MAVCVNAGIEQLIIPWPEPPKRMLRISAQLYNQLEQYLALARGIDSRDAGG